MNQGPNLYAVISLIIDTRLSSVFRVPVCSISSCSRLCALNVLGSSLINTFALFYRDVYNIARRTIEQNIDLLQRQAFGLWQAEEDENYRQAGDACEHKVCAVPDVSDHIWHGSCNDEVEQPVSGCAYRHPQPSNVQWEDLRTVDPRYS